MFSKHIRHMVVIIGMGFVVIAFFGSICYARERTDLPQHYPDQFSGQGQIDRIAAEEIVINDCFFRFSKYPVFNSHTHLNVSIKHFHEGDSVYYIKNDKGEIESLWEKR